MQKSTTFQMQRIAEAGKNLLLAILLMLMALGQMPVIVSGPIVRPLISVEILVLTLIYITVAFGNIYRLIPHLLLRGKYFSYVCSLFGLAMFLALMVVFCEWLPLRVYRLTPSVYSFFSNNSSLILGFLSVLICHFISLAATSLIVFLRHWRQSGKRIHELEETGVRVELEKARTRIDSGALFDVLDKAASCVVSIPHEASRMLKELSQSLRRQLYESDREHFFSALTKKTNHPFREQNHLLNFLIDKRYRWVRNLLLILAVCIIGSANTKPNDFITFLGFAIFSGIFLSIIYFNIYVLLPRLLLKNNFFGYFAVVFSFFIFFLIIFIVLLLMSDMDDDLKSTMGMTLISNIVQVGFVITGTTAFVIFQHWARNERYIAQLEAATMQAELEQLQNQINPHFLFNMLNNILVLIHESPEEAVIILQKMSDMLKYQFNDSTKKEVRLIDDIHFLTDFLNLEEIRRDNSEFTISVENDMENIFIPPLLFIPFVENAVKHSADAVNKSFIRLYFKTSDKFLHFSCHNSKPIKPKKKNEFSGIGFANIKRRLELLYNENHSLNIQEDETSYTVQLSIKI